MATTPSWGPAKYGALQAAPVDPNSTQLSQIPTGSSETPSGTPGEILHPNNPLVAFGVIAAVAFGLMAFSTSASVRVGKEKAGVGIKIGDTK